MAPNAMANLKPGPGSRPAGRAEDALYQAGFLGGNRGGLQTLDIFGLVRWNPQDRSPTVASFGELQSFELTCAITWGKRYRAKVLGNDPGAAPGGEQIVVTDPLVESSGNCASSSRCTLWFSGDPGSTLPMAYPRERPASLVMPAVEAPLAHRGR
jgi:hypothetical protein